MDSPISPYPSAFRVVFFFWILGFQPDFRQPILAIALDVRQHHNPKIPRDRRSRGVL